MAMRGLRRGGFLERGAGSGSIVMSDSAAPVLVWNDRHRLLAARHGRTHVLVFSEMLQIGDQGDDLFLGPDIRSGGAKLRRNALGLFVHSFGDLLRSPVRIRNTQLALHR